ncbi:oxidoreductase [Granulicella sibirica]|uniref:Putative oxidoreductase ydgJ n=1 Tax=Granulicella sibirica TaxID=2479048 RepID=A0A4Q0SYM4_9BACT|nr:oxidoreductase [Granulicella sibirica]RXH54301.1 putative oxidoreductase ydgJ [Granulicella sibirica]
MSGSKEAVRVGLIGYGYAGKTFHAPNIRAVPNLPLTVVGSSKRDVLAVDIPEAIVCAPEEVPTHPDVDLVVIATPNDSHFPLAAAAMRAGKDVVIDKPFTVTLAEARELQKIAVDTGRLLSVFHNRRWDSEILATKAVLESGALGQVTHYECHMDRYRPNVRKRWREDPGPGAGLWFDLGPHLIDAALYLFGLPHSVSATIRTMRPGGLTDDYAHVQLFYDKMNVILNATIVAAKGGPRSVVHGMAGTWMKYGLDVQEAQLVSGMPPTDPRFGVDPDPGLLFDGATGTRTEISAPPSNQSLYYASIRDAILSGHPAEIPARDAVAVMAILETTFKSAAEGRVLPLSLTQEERAAWS